MKPLIKISSLLLIVLSTMFLLINCKDDEGDNNQNSIAMIDFSIRSNPCYYYNHADFVPDSLIAFNWNINNIDSNIAIIINSQEEFLNYITIKEGENTPTIDFNKYSLITVRVSTCENLGEPTKILNKISENNYKLTFNCYQVTGTADISERTWVQAMLITKISSNANIDFKLNVFPPE